jgi:hypothetical protein
MVVEEVLVESEPRDSRRIAPFAQVCEGERAEAVER